jgi:hypothetical protein
MAKTAVPESKAHGSKVPAPKFPMIDLEAVFGLQKANLAALHEVQSVLLDAAQAIARIQHAWFQDNAGKVRSLLDGKALPKQPQAVLADVRAAAQQAVVAGKEGMDLGVAAQQRVARLVTQRVQANLDGFKALAA